jgi:hypothetical protein
MKFESSFSTQEKKLIYMRTLKDLEKQLMERLILEGIDPDAFDVGAFVPGEDGHGIIQGHKNILDLLAKIETVKVRLVG